MIDITPSDEQWKAVQAIVTWYRNGSRSPQVFYLAGYAGTGKSTVFKLVLRTLQERCGLKKHALACFTGKAANVLRQKGNDEAQTIHSLIYIPDGEDEGVPQLDGGQPATDRKRDPTRDMRFTLATDGPASEVDLIALDECSMVDEEMGLDVLSFGKKVLVMGDPGQLPPVRGAGYFQQREPDVFLHEVHRQAADSPILMLATLAREGKPLPIGEWDAGPLGHARVLAHGRETQRELYRPETQAICGIHRVRKGYTARIRALRGFEGRLPMVGEPLICGKNNRERKLFNGAAGTLISPPDPYKRLAGDDEVMSALQVFNLQMEDHRHPLEAVLVHPHLFWAHFMDVEQPRMKKNIEFFDWAYVLTGHKAQGSEWPNVTVVDDGGAFREDCHRWRYTCITRASADLTFLKR